MAHDYPHISDTRFPDLDTTNVYKYENNYDYDVYKDNIKIKMMNVSWCGDYDNVVYFDTKEERDKWFMEQKGLVKELNTMFRLYNDGSIKVDLPIDECMDYNYLMIDYGKLPNQGELSDNYRMFYFINDMTQASVNATSLHVSVDYWTTYINDMDISYVNLQRGHAPMAETTVDEYLANPLDNSEYLLTQDVNYGVLQRVASNENIILNDGDMMLGFMINAQLNGDWSDRVPAQTGWAFSQAFSAVDTFVTDIKNWDKFRTDVMRTYPWFFKTVAGMFIIPKKLVKMSDDITFCGIKCHHLESNGDKFIDTFKVSKDKFNYPENIKRIAKLYTFPYSAIEVNDFKGNTTLIKIEDTIGNMEVHTIMCDMYPFLNVEAYMTGIGSGIKTTIDFVNTYNNHYTISGRDYDFNTKWNIPIFAVRLTAEKAWSTMENIKATASRSNARASAYTAKTNADLNADAAYNATIVAANWAVDRTELHNDLLEANAGLQNTKLVADSITDMTIAVQSTDVENDIVAMTGVTNAVTGAVNGAMTGAAIGAPTGPGAVPFAIGGAIVGAASAGVSAAITIGGNSRMCQVSNSGVSSKTSHAVNYINNGTNQNIAFNTASITGETNASKTQAALFQTATKAAASNSRDTSLANADRTYDAAHEQRLIDALPQFGQLTGTPDIVNKPFGLRYNIITQSKNAIRQAAEQFLRYGYHINMEWNVDTFNKMKKFTYWKCNVVYCNDNGVYEGAQNMIKSILVNGTTVWRKPEEIGLVSIYQNI